MPLKLGYQEMKDKNVGFATKRIEKPYLEAMNLFQDIFEHDFDKGAKTTLTLGIPGSGKTSIDCHIAEHYIKNCRDDLIFWRSAFSAPLQFLKLSKWHIWIQDGSGVRIYDRSNRKDATQLFENNGWITYFHDIPDLYESVKQSKGVVNALFFKDLHLKNVQEGTDMGTIMWFRFIRHLIEGDDWCAVFLDEAQEMAAIGSSEQMWYEIQQHSRDLSNARKCLTAIHANCHQTSEIDYRVISNYQMLIQSYGARHYHNSPVNRDALMRIPKPNPHKGLYAWISSGNRFGKFLIRTVYTMPMGMNYNAKIDPNLEWMLSKNVRPDERKRHKAERSILALPTKRKPTCKTQCEHRSPRDPRNVGREYTNFSRKTLAYNYESNFIEALDKSIFDLEANFD